MKRKLGRVGLGAGLSILLVLLASFPFAYPYLSARLGVRPGAGVNVVDLGSKDTQALTPRVFLDYADVALQSLQKGNYTRTQLALRYMDDLPPDTANNLRIYLIQISILASDITSMSKGLDQLKQYIESGRLDLAHKNVTQIEALFSEAVNRLGLLSSALDRIEAIYDIDVSRQRGYLADLQEILKEFRQRLDTIETELQTSYKQLATQITLDAFPNPVMINGTLTLQGQLRKSNGTGLVGRAVSLWVNMSQIANVSVDVNGIFIWTYRIPTDSHPNVLEIYADFQPVGQDVDSLRPTSSNALDVRVSYEPVVLTASAITNSVHVLESFGMSGRLTDLESNPLPNETVWLLVDDKPVNNSQTDFYGYYAFTSYFPVNATEGNHELLIQYDPTRGIYGSARSEVINVTLYYLDPEIRIASRENSTLAFSGQSLDLNGTLEIGSSPLSQGLVIVFGGQRELGRAISGSDGSFRVPIKVPFESSGLTTLTVMFIPTAPWVLSSSTILTLNILNIAILGSGFFALAAAVVTLSTETVRRRTRSTGAVGGSEQVTLEMLRVGEKSVQATATMHLVRLRMLVDPRLCVKETYWEVRRLIWVVLYDSGQMSETHREFEARVNTRLSGAASAFSALTLQFEHAEYSLHAISPSDAQKTINFAILVAEALNVKVEYSEDWQNFVEKSRMTAAEVLRRFGLSTWGIFVGPRNVIVEIPWYIPAEERVQLNSVLENVLGMPAGSMQVRFCDRCGYKMTGPEVEKQRCPRCARSFKEETS